MRTIIVNTPGPQGAVGPQGVAGPSGSTQPFNNVSGSIWATTSSLQVTGSFIISGSSTFTNIGPAVFSGSTSLVGATTMSSALVSGNVTVLGTASINVLQINTTINSTGSNTLGDAANDTQTLFGSVVIPTGSLIVSGSTIIRGSGATESTNAFIVQNNAGNAALTITNGLTTVVNQDLQLGNTVLYWNGGNQMRNISNGVLRITNSSNSDFTRLQFGGGTNLFPSIQRVSASLAIVDATGGNSGSLLIGTTTDAGFKLDVNGDVRLGGNIQMGVPLAGTTSFRFFAGTSAGVQGNVTIAGLGVNGVFLGLGGGVNATSGNNLGICRAFLNEMSAVAYGFVGLDNAIPMTFRFGAYNSSVEAMRLTTSSIILSPNTGSNVLVGTTTTSGAKLQIKGSGATSATTAFLVQNSSLATIFQIKDDGLCEFVNNNSYVKINNLTFSKFGSYQITGGNNAFIDLSSSPNLQSYFGSNNGITMTVDTKTGDSGYFQVRQRTAYGGSPAYKTLFQTSNNGTVLINSTTEDLSAVLKVDSTTQGFLPPRMTTTQKNAIATPAAGLMVYDTDLSKVNFYNGASWNNTGLGVAQVTPVTLASGSWSLASSLYEYDYSNALITSSSIVDIIPDNSTIAIVQAAQVLPSTVSTSGSVKLFATNLPTADIIVTVNIFN